MVMHQFHPAVADWFERHFSELSEVQALAWPAILAKSHTLITAPTDSGKHWLLTW